MSTGVAVRAEGLVQIYLIGDTNVAALQGIDLAVEPGEQVALLGPSGSGKSTLLGLLAGVLRPSAGRLLLDDVNTVRADDATLRRLRATRVGTLLQGAPHNLVGHLDARQNIAFARRASGRRARRALPSAGHLLEALGLAAVADRPVSLLSGGEQQRAALATAVANGPGLLLADEPTSELDADSREQVLGLMRESVAESGGTLVVVTHDPVVAEHLPRRVVLRDGRIVSDTGGRSGGFTERTVVRPDGSVPLPRDVSGTWPPGTEIVVTEDGDGLRVRRVEGSEQS